MGSRLDLRNPKIGVWLPEWRFSPQRFGPSRLSRKSSHGASYRPQDGTALQCPLAAPVERRQWHLMSWIAHFASFGALISANAHRFWRNSPREAAEAMEVPKLKALRSLKSWSMGLPAFN